MLSPAVRLHRPLDDHRGTAGFVAGVEDDEHLQRNARPGQREAERGHELPRPARRWPPPPVVLLVGCADRPAQLIFLQRHVVRHPINHLRRVRRLEDPADIDRRSAETPLRSERSGLRPGEFQMSFHHAGPEAGTPADQSGGGRESA